MNKSLSLVFIVLTYIFVLNGSGVLKAEAVGKELPATPKKHVAKENQGHTRHYLQSVGPGEGPHFHSVDRTQFQHIPDIARNPSQVPSPASHSSPKTVRFHLKFKEVVAPLAEETSYLYWTFNGTVPGPLLRARVGDTVELTLSNHPTADQPSLGSITINPYMPLVIWLGTLGVAQW